MSIHDNSQPKNVPIESDPHVTQSKVKEFKRGNINFDFLQPDEEFKISNAQVRLEERRDQSRDGKRGLFNRGRTINPVGKVAVFVWYSIFVLSLAGLTWSIFTGNTILHLLVIPMLSLSSIGSLMMIALFKARPG